MGELFYGELPMKKIPLTRGKFAIVDDEDFDFLIQYKWHALKIGNVFYAGTRMYNVRGTRMHYFVFGYPLEGFVIDHINRDGLDNRKSNLRLATISLNMMNSKLFSTNTSGYRGVRYSKSHHKWVARICSKYYPFQHYYDTQEEAIQAYAIHAEKLKILQSA